MHAFDAPVGTDRLGSALAGQDGGRDEIARLAGGFATPVGCGGSFDQAFDGPEAIVTGIMAIAFQPIDIVADRLGSDFDAAMILVGCHLKHKAAHRPRLPPISNRPYCNGKCSNSHARRYHGCVPDTRPRDATDRQPRDHQSRGRSVAALYNSRRPHSSLDRKTPDQA